MTLFLILLCLIFTNIALFAIGVDINGIRKILKKKYGEGRDAD